MALLCRVLSDALEHIHQIRVRVAPVQPTDRKQALQRADMARTDLTPAEVPVLAPHRITRSAHFRWLVSVGTPGSLRSTRSGPSREWT